MKNEIRFRDLAATNAHRCSVMMPNHMQCTNRAVFGIAPDKDVEKSRNEETYICRHHFSVERVINEREGTKYIAHDVLGNRVDETKETYEPPQN